MTDPESHTSKVVSMDSPCPKGPRLGHEWIKIQGAFAVYFVCGGCGAGSLG